MTYPGTIATGAAILALSAGLAFGAALTSDETGLGGDILCRGR